MNYKERMCMVILRAAVFLSNRDDSTNFLYRIEQAVKDYCGRKVLHKVNENGHVEMIYFDNYLR